MDRLDIVFAIWLVSIPKRVSEALNPRFASESKLETASFNP